MRKQKSSPQNLAGKRRRERRNSININVRLLTLRTNNSRSEHVSDIVATNKMLANAATNPISGAGIDDCEFSYDII